MAIGTAWLAEVGEAAGTAAAVAWAVVRIGPEPTKAGSRLAADARATTRTPRAARGRLPARPTIELPDSSAPWASVYVALTCSPVTPFRPAYSRTRRLTAPS